MGVHGGKYDPRLDTHPTLKESMRFQYEVRPRFSGSGECWVRIFEPVGKAPVVVITELPDNHGVSVTNAIELIVVQLASLFSLPGGTLWIEHYTDRRDGIHDDDTWGETFDVVRLDIGTPKWLRPEEGALFAWLDGSMEAGDGD